MNHPNVVQIYGVGIDAGRVWLAMELVRGKTLKEWAENNPPGTEAQRDKALALLRQAAEGLSAAHEESMTHRDFKPANVLIGDDGRVRVVDFGLAMSSAPLEKRDRARSLLDESAAGLQVLDDSVTRTGAVMGTPRYMAPEQHRGEMATARSDQFSFAVTAWELLHGCPPFSASSAFALYDAVEGGRFNTHQTNEVPSWMTRALQRSLSLSPKHRHRSMRALVRALDRTPRRRRIGWSTALRCSWARGGWQPPRPCLNESPTSLRKPPPARRPRTQPLTAFGLRRCGMDCSEHSQGRGSSMPRTLAERWSAGPMGIDKLGMRPRRKPARAVRRLRFPLHRACKPTCKRLAACWMVGGR